jgi:hypothetical protein
MGKKVKKVGELLLNNRFINLFLLIATISIVSLEINSIIKIVSLIILYGSRVGLMFYNKRELIKDTFESVKLSIDAIKILKERENKKSNLIKKGRTKL